MPDELYLHHLQAPLDLGVKIRSYDLSKNGSSKGFLYETTKFKNENFNKLWDDEPDSSKNIINADISLILDKSPYNFIDSRNALM